MDHLIDHPVILFAFGGIVLLMLLLDLGVFHKQSHVINSKEAAIWSVVWIGLSMLFSVFIYILTNQKAGIEPFAQFQSAYWIEKALSVDNLFVFILVFSAFKVPAEYQHKVLFWGIFGAIIMRAIFIFFGVGLIKLTYIPEIELFGKLVSINIVLSLFGAFLIFAGIKSWFAKHNDENAEDYKQNQGAKFIYKLFKVSSEYDGGKFFTLKNGVKMATPMLVVVGVIEFTDLLFAVDSIPAIFAIAPDDPFILYTSNIFAILGLRSLYFLLANYIQMFSKLKYGIAIILTFIGFKMLAAPFIHLSSLFSLMFLATILTLSIVASVIFPEKSAS